MFKVTESLTSHWFRGSWLAVILFKSFLVCTVFSFLTNHVQLTHKTSFLYVWHIHESSATQVKVTLKPCSSKLYKKTSTGWYYWNIIWDFFCTDMYVPLGVYHTMPWTQWSACLSRRSKVERKHPAPKIHLPIHFGWHEKQTDAFPGNAAAVATT